MEETRLELIESLGVNRMRLNEPMSRHTTFRIGGPADYYFEARSVEELQKALKLCRDNGLPYLVFGVGANLLVGDKGVRGLAIRPMMNEMKVVGSFNPSLEPSSRVRTPTHYKSFDENQYLKFDDLEIDEPPPETLVRVGAGVLLSQLIIWSLERGLTGLQNFAGIPASVGGGLYNNIHGGTRLFDEFVHEVILLDKEGRPAKLSAQEMEFSYDQSRLQHTGEIVLEAILKLSRGDIERARRVRWEWLRRKLKVQPQTNCPGCIFKNISPEAAERIGSPTVAAGWVLDVGLGLKGTKVGGVSVSSQHANFFVNDGSGRAGDVLSLIQLCKERAKSKFGLELAEEIQLVGEF